MKPQNPEILAILSSTRNVQSTGKRGFRDGTHKNTDDSLTFRLRDWISPKGRFSKNTIYSHSYNFPNYLVSLDRFWAVFYLGQVFISSLFHFRNISERNREITAHFEPSNPIDMISPAKFPALIFYLNFFYNLLVP